MIRGQLELRGKVIAVQESGEELHLVGPHCDAGKVHVSHPTRRRRVATDRCRHTRRGLQLGGPASRCRM
jgi:hypothetical protein